MRQTGSGGSTVWFGTMKYPKRKPVLEHAKAEESTQRFQLGGIQRRSVAACGCQALVTGEEVSQRKPVIEDNRERGWRDDVAHPVSLRRVNGLYLRHGLLKRAWLSVNLVYKLAYTSKPKASSDHIDRLAAMGSVSRVPDYNDVKVSAVDWLLPQVKLRIRTKLTQAMPTPCLNRPDDR